MPRAPAETSTDPGRAVFLWAGLTTLAMFPLIWMGGLVTSKDVGMAVPDWPNTFGYNMWSVPWAQWLGGEAGGVFHEHFHRLLGTLAGFFAVATVMAAYGMAQKPGRRRKIGIVTLISLGVAIGGYAFLKLVSPFSYGVNKNLWHVVSLGGALGVTTGVAWFLRKPDPRAWVRWLTVGLLGAIIVQGILGGVRVLGDSREVAMVHGIFGQLTLCVGGLATLVATRWWWTVDRDHRPAVAWPAVVLLGLCVAQLAVASVMRHTANENLQTGSGLAINDFPLHYGKVLPPTDDASLAEANVYRAFEYQEPPVTMADVWLHVTHRLGAYLITAFTIFVAWRLWNVSRKTVLLVTLLVATQVTLGILTVLLGKPADVATLHVATGATLLLSVAMLSARLVRVYGLMPARQPAREDSPDLSQMPEVAAA